MEKLMAKREEEPEKSQPEAPELDPWLGYSEKEKDFLKKAQEKYKTPADLRKGSGWAEKPPGEVKPQYHKT